MLTLDHISKTFNPGTINEKRALDGLSLHLKPGDFVTVIGGNGAGKSTMLNAVAGVWPVDSGRIILDGVDVTAMPEYRRAQYIGRVFQDPMMGTAANMQIEENLALAARRGKKRTLRWGVTKAEREEYHEKLKSFGLGLEHIHNHFFFVYHKFVIDCFENPVFIYEFLQDAFQDRFAVFWRKFTKFLKGYEVTLRVVYHHGKNAICFQ